MPPTQQVEVHFTPPPARLLAGTTCLMIDTLRATTVITTLIARGAAAVYPIATLEAARLLARDLNAKLVGERHGLPVEGFDYGNSPAEFASIDMQGWVLVQSTTNGSRALEHALEAERTFIACLRNAATAAKIALGTSADGAIAIVCSGDGGGTQPSVEDAYTAGALVERLLALRPALDAQAGARLARRIFAAYGEPANAFADAPHAANLRDRGLGADLEFAAQLDVESAVPQAAVDAQGRLCLVAG